MTLLLASTGSLAALQDKAKQAAKQKVVEDKTFGEAGNCSLALASQQMDQQPQPAPLAQGLCCSPLVFCRVEKQGQERQGAEVCRAAAEECAAAAQGGAHSQGELLGTRGELGGGVGLCCGSPRALH